MTKDQLLKFIELQNEPNGNNYIDILHNAYNAGFDLDELSEGNLFDNKWYWHTEHGTIIEENGISRLD